MRLHFAVVPVFGASTAAEEELNRFLASHRVLAVDRHLIADGQASAWVLCVSHVEAGGANVPEKKGRLDYREILPDDEFAVFARLRSLRKRLSERDGVPAYALFTNEQLAAMVRGRATSLGMLAAIEGVGQARVDKYGAPFLDVLREWVAGANPQGESEGATNAGAGSGQEKPRQPE